MAAVPAGAGAGDIASATTPPPAGEAGAGAGLAGLGLGEREVLGLGEGDAAGLALGAGAGEALGLGLGLLASTGAPSAFWAAVRLTALRSAFTPGTVQPAPHQSANWSAGTGLCIHRICGADGQAERAGGCGLVKLYSCT